MSKDDFKKLSTDDKLASPYDMMCSLGSVNTRVVDLEQDVQALFAWNADSDQRMKFLEYKTIGLEARSRRNNLIFRGHNELVNEDDSVSIIRTFLSDKLKLDPTPIHIQMALDPL